MKPPLRVGVLASGSGSNLQALLDACAAPDSPAEISVVLSNVPSAFAIERARKAHVPAVLVDHTRFASRDAFDAALVEALQAHRVEAVCLAGFMRLVGAPLLSAFSGRILNIHPSLLPAFPGLHAVRQALAQGVRVSGCTVHLVDAGLDSGPIILQSAVPVLPDDDEATLAKRILAEEHKAYPLALRLFAEGRLQLDGRRVLLSTTAGGAPLEPVLGPLSLRNPGLPG